MAYQLTFHFDRNECIDCKTCETACNDYYGLAGAQRTTNMYETTPSTLPAHLLTSCFHCRHPICVAVCPENNFIKRYDGIVIRKSERCKRCRLCIEACPFQAIKLNMRTKKVSKCDFCVERLDEGLEPVCIENCITGALSFMEVAHNERVTSDNSLAHFNIPMMGHVYPSIIIVAEQLGDIYLRKG